MKVEDFCTPKGYRCRSYKVITKKVQKGIDKRERMWYNVITKKKGENKMEKMRYNYKMVTVTIPAGFELVMENTVKSKNHPNAPCGSALVRNKNTGIYGLVNAGCYRSVDQNEVKKFLGVK